MHGQYDWTRDPARDLTSRTRLFIGPGYHVYDDSKRTLNLSLGPNAVIEKIGEGENEESVGSVAIQATLRYEQRFLADDLIAFWNIDYSSIIRGRENNVFENSLGFRYDVTDDIYVNLQFERNHESNPASNREKTDVTYIIGAGIDF